MSKEIWLGPVLGNNRERLLARCAEYISSGRTDRLLYLAASHPLLDLVTERLLDGREAPGVWGEFPIYLFRGFVRRVLASAHASEARDSQADSPAGMGPSAGTIVGSEPMPPRGPLAPRVAIDREEFPLRRSLISQIIKQLSSAEKLSAIRPLANREGCVTTVSSLIGELQRAGKTPAEFQQVVETRDAELPVQSPKSKVQRLKAQIDFDREVALIYSAYVEALDRFGLTDEDADQLRALEVLRGEVDGQVISNPWLNEVDLLVLDGFFDFTPVQGEILRALIPSLPNVVVNLNYDQRNEEIFRPFQSTIEHLKAMDNLEIRIDNTISLVADELARLRESLFNSTGGIGPSDKVSNASGNAGEPRAVTPADRPQDAGAPIGAPITTASVILLECSDRETEIRSIAKEIKTLILQQGYRLSEVALVVRERAAYADTILRVFEQEEIPCNLERRIEAQDVPAFRACAKLFQIFKDSQREKVKNPRAGDLAHLVKTGYFRISAGDLSALAATFDKKYGPTFRADFANQDSDAKLRERLGIGRWSPDAIENVIAYVGSELRVRAWLERAQRLLEVLPSDEAARSFIAGDQSNEGDDASAVPEEEPPPEDAPVRERRRRPTPIHPATIAWTTLVMEHLRELIANLPDEGQPEELRSAIMSLLERLEFSQQVSRPLNRTPLIADVPQTTLDLRGLESLRRAMAAVIRSFDYAEKVVSDARPLSGSTANGRSLTVGPASRPTLSSFIDEVERSIQSQVLALASGNRDGLRVLEATDVRGLRFRAVFIAGMIEGSFPLRTGHDWLYPHEERERLKQYGVVLEDISSDTLLKEEHYFYQAACRATDRLYLTRPLALNDGSETVASYYIEELKRAIAPAEIKIEAIRSDIDNRELSKSSTLSELAAGLIRQSTRPDHLTPPPNRLPPNEIAGLVENAQAHGCLSDSVMRRVSIELERNGPSFGPYDGQITHPDLQAMIRARFGPEYIYSASGLSAYGNCAFRFFMARVLKLEPRNEAALDLQAIDAGKLLHDVLRRFFEKHRKQFLPDLDREALRQEMIAVADQVFGEHERMVPPLNQRIWKIDCEIRKLILEQVLLYELRLQARTRPRGILPTYFELAFGRASQASDPASSPEYLKFERPDKTETALIQGQIDRVDVNPRAREAVAYDYKMSFGAKLDDIESGRQVQIPIYLAALEQIFVRDFQLAGGGYYKLRGRGPRLNQGLYRRMMEDCTDVSSRNTKLDDIEWQRIRNQVRARIWQFIDGMRGGNFEVDPSLGKETCKFCEYSAVCRYDTYRISRKRTA
ncbi:MAG TPA: PD-(D/E)XK nuclease family protein [Pyrinomonadaceae bacterium]|nr:PD-(D/E)XK nuclease family protein [Pyrinomonadaceae bacterium]